MAARPPIEITRERERRAWMMRQQLMTEQAIADELDVDVSTVSRMIKRITARLAKSFEGRAGHMRALQTEQLEHIGAEAMAAWERSKRDAETRDVMIERVEIDANVRSQGGEIESIALPATKTRETITTKGTAGDARFLAEARSALGEIRDIWGLDAPKRTDLTSDGQVVKALIGIDLDKV